MEKYSITRVWKINNKVDRGRRLEDQVWRKKS